MRRVVGLYRSSVGKKVIMAVTGFVWFGYLVAHMAGNLKAFFGEDSFNSYAEHLRLIGVPFLPETGFLWPFRAFIFVALVVHVWMAWETSRKSQAARTVAYRQKENINFNWASATMRWGGVLILVFIVYHILHLTVGWVHPDFVYGDAYGNLVRGLSNPVVAVFYIVSMAAVCAHLWHGLWSMLQTLGADHPKYESLRRPFATGMALLIFFGFISIPVAILAGLVS